MFKIGFIVSDFSIDVFNESEPHVTLTKLTGVSLNR